MEHYGVLFDFTVSYLTFILPLHLKIFERQRTEKELPPTILDRDSKHN